MDELLLILDRDGDFDLAMDDAGELELAIENGTTIAAYPGPYIVTPVLYEDQTFKTNGLLMADDMTVKSIPVVYTINPYDGKTVVIG